MSFNCYCHKNFLSPFSLKKKKVHLAPYVESVLKSLLLLLNVDLRKHSDSLG